MHQGAKAPTVEDKRIGNEDTVDGTSQVFHKKIKNSL